MSFEVRPKPKRKGVGIGLLLLIVVGMTVYILYTDEVTGTIDSIQTASDIDKTIKGFTDLLPLSLASVAVDGDTICDLDLSIPTMVSNRAFFGTSAGDVISIGEDTTIKLPQLVIAEFLNEPQWYYIGTENQNPPFFEWKNCFTQGTASFASLIPIFSADLASEKLSLLSFDTGTREFTSLDPNAANLGPFTESTQITLAISGKNSEGLFLVDKFNKANFARSVVVPDGLAYPISDDLRFTIENVKLDDYEISVVSVKPINEMVIREPFVFNITG